MKLHCIIFVLFSFSIVVAQETSPHAPLPRKLCQTCPMRASLVQLIATPEKFDGQLVQVEGFVSLEFEDYGLYLSRDDYEYLNGDNGVWLDFAPAVLTGEQQRKKLQGRYVRIEGTFDAKQHGHMGSFAGTVREIKRIEPSFSRSKYKQLERSKGSK